MACRERCGAAPLAEEGEGGTTFEHLCDSPRLVEFCAIAAALLPELPTAQPGRAEWVVSVVSVCSVAHEERPSGSGRFPQPIWTRQKHKNPNVLKIIVLVVCVSSKTVGKFWKKTKPHPENFEFANMFCIF